METGRPTTLRTGCCIGSISTFISNTLLLLLATVNRQADRQSVARASRDGWRNQKGGSSLLIWPSDRDQPQLGRVMLPQFALHLFQHLALTAFIGVNGWF